MTAKVKWGSLAVGVVLVLAVLNLPNPYTGDQALFDVGGRMMAHGAVYYRDFWDIKQPGIFLFYEAGGRLFGFTSVGVHLLELIWMTAFAVVLLYAMRNRFGSPVALALVALLTVGWYYLTVLPAGQAQIEPLIAFPLFIVLWATMKMAEDDGRAARWALLAGVAMGVVALFKLLIVAVALWFWATALWRMAKKSDSGARIARVLAAGALGSAVIILPFLAYWATNDMLDLVYRTTVVYPPQITRLGGMHSAGLLARLVGAIVLTYAWLGALALIGVVWRARRREVDALTVNLVGWAVIAGVVMLAQRWSIYQGELLLAPLGILAARTIDDLIVEWHPRSPRAVAGVVGGLTFLALLSVWYPAQKANALVRNGLALSVADREGYRRAMSTDYNDVASDLDHFPALPGPGALYVMGNPLYSDLLDKDQPIALNGWSPEQWLDDQWAWFEDQIDAARPEFLLVDEPGADLIADHPEVEQLLELLYRPFATSSFSGTWYQLRSPT